MPRGPQGQKRPADVIGNAVTVARIATGEIAETGYERLAKVEGVRSGGAARKRVLSPERTPSGAVARWGRVVAPP